MARVPAVPEEQAGLLGKLAYRYARRRFGAVPEPFAVMRHHPRLFWAGALAEAAAEKAATVLPRRLRELAVYRTATVVGCSWCVDFGTMLQRLGGLSVDRLQHIDEYAESPLFTPAERLAIAYADAMTAQPMAVTDDQVAALEQERAGPGSSSSPTRSRWRTSGPGSTTRWASPTRGSRQPVECRQLLRVQDTVDRPDPVVLQREHGHRGGDPPAAGTSQPGSPLTRTGGPSRKRRPVARQQSDQQPGHLVRRRRRGAAPPGRSRRRR